MKVGHCVNHVLFWRRKRTLAVGKAGDLHGKNEWRRTFAKDLPKKKEEESLSIPPLLRVAAETMES